MNAGLAIPAAGRGSVGASPHHHRHLLALRRLRDALRPVIVAALVLLAGCGPLSPLPAVIRVSPAQQKNIDYAWHSMTTTPGVDRLLLLDCIIVQQLHQFGVDSLTMTARKRVEDGEVEMIIRFDRDDPDVDEFVVSFVDLHGQPVWQEFYAGDEVRGRAEFLLGVQINHPRASEPDAPAAASTPVETDPDANDAINAAREARLEEIALLTAPPASGDESEE